MDRARSHAASPALIALLGLAGLAAAMGIGRFAFTPMLPLMQADSGLSLREGGWLAGANYLGYLAGGLTCLLLSPRPGRAARGGLVAVAMATLVMAFTTSFTAWWLLRAVAGVASAWVLVGISGWAPPALAARGRADLTGWVYAGVGAGITVAGAAGLVIGHGGQGSRLGWLVLGVAAAAVAAATWRRLADPPVHVPDANAAATPSSPHHAPQAATSTPPALADAVRLSLCYGAFGFGYIIPATFLPAMARQVIADPLVFGWIWPVFGLAAALSTVLGGRLFRTTMPRRLWAGSQLVMAVGVLLPVLHAGLGVLVASAVLIGGTFMVATMSGLQEARRIGGPQGTRLAAAMTSAFALGQLIGPLAVSAAAGTGDPILVPSLVAVALLLASSGALLRRPTGPEDHRQP